MIRYQVVDHNHKLCQDNCPTDIHHFMQKFWESRELDNCDGAVVATKGKEIVGFFRFYDQIGTVYGAGTYVLSPYRQQGVALKLWNRAIKHLNPHTIDVTITSANAIKLLRAVSHKHNGIRWRIWKDDKQVFL